MVCGTGRFACYRPVSTASCWRRTVAEIEGAPRRQEILLVDFAASSQALVKVRVRVDTILYVDYLSLHLISGCRLVTAKSFHVERRFEPAAA
jgi:hypothetical protein